MSSAVGDTASEYEPSESTEWVAVFDDEAGIGGQNKIVRLASDDLEAALLEQRQQRCQPGGADLLFFDFIFKPLYR